MTSVWVVLHLEGCDSFSRGTIGSIHSSEIAAHAQVASYRGLVGPTNIREWTASDDETFHPHKEG